MLNYDDAGSCEKWIIIFKFVTYGIVYSVTRALLNFGLDIDSGRHLFHKVRVILLSKVQDMSCLK